MRYVNYFSLITFLSIMLFNSCKNQDLDTVSSVDLEKYAGKWFDIASFPQRFQKGCENTTATYTLTDKGYVIVENRCKKQEEITYIKGKAFVQKNSGNAKLKVQFFWPFRGKYWIIELDKNYQYAVVGHPNRKYLWILSREPKMNNVLYEELLKKIESKGFDINKIEKVVHN
jgi:apolipoprotein D and lipocalin family protein